jgi:uncharacterized protein YmfQ (DUF2313 family)
MAVMTEAEYVEMQLALLPNGEPWPKDPDSWWALLFKAFYPEYVREAEMREQLLKEMSVSTAELLFEDYETEYGLPSPCVHEDQTLSQRRNALIVKESAIAQPSIPFFTQLAADLGYEITITEFNADNPGPAITHAGHQLQGDDWNFVWRFNAPATTEHWRTCGSEIGEPFSTAGDELLECTLKNYNHAHRIMLASYGS